MLISVKVLAKCLINIYALDSANEKFDVPILPVPESLQS